MSLKSLVRTFLLAALTIQLSATSDAVDDYYSSPVGADGKVYMASQAGKVTVLEATGDWPVLATNELGEDIYATPAIADGRIYLRTMDTLYCFGKKP